MNVPYLGLIKTTFVKLQISFCCWWGKGWGKERLTFTWRSVLRVSITLDSRQYGQGLTLEQNLLYYCKMKGQSLSRQHGIDQLAVMRCTIPQDHPRSKGILAQSL